MEQKVFYKSLDHLGLTFKQADKKLLTTRQLVSEISTVKVEQQNKRLHPLTPKPQEQLNYKFEDYEILVDILKLADVFINRSSNYSANDREKLSQFFQFFLSRFFNISTEQIKESLSEREKVDKPEEKNNVDGSVSDSSEGQIDNTSAKKRHRENDLLRDVLKKQSKSRKDDRAESPSQVSSESEDQEGAEDVNKLSELWIKATSSQPDLANNTTNNEEKRDKYNLFCNTIIYVFFRHLRTLYERLKEIKAMNATVGKEIRSRKSPSLQKI